MSHTLAELAAAVVAFRDARDWRQFHSPKDVGLSLTLEVAELLEWMQWRSGDDLTAHLAAHRNEVGEELADVLYWVVLLANDLGVDLDAAFARKMDANERKYPVERARGSHAKYTDLGS